MTQALPRHPAVIDDADLLWRGAAIVKAASARGGLRVADAMLFGGG
jgi:hypothetical protein